MKVSIAVHGRFHAFDLARELATSGASVSLATTYPAMIARRWLPQTVILRTAPSLELLRRATASLPLFPSTDFWITSRFGLFAARHLPATSDVFVGWSGASLEAIEVARARGIPVVIERGSSHIAHQAAILAAEYSRHGRDGPAVDPRMITRELAEYEAADAIMVPSHFAARTFVENGITQQKVIVNPYGVDLRPYAALPVERERSAHTRILFVGSVGLRKGTPALVEAFGRLGESYELHLVGPVDPRLLPLLKPLLNDRVFVHGPLRGGDLIDRFSRADIFCLPSLEEGLALALLQAMASGLPVVATPETGAEDVVMDGCEGLLVPARDPDRLAAALLRLADRDQRLAMGTAARNRVAASFGWPEYGTRALAAYRALLSKKPAN